LSVLLFSEATLSESVAFKRSIEAARAVGKRKFSGSACRLFHKFASAARARKRRITRSRDELFLKNCFAVARG
jgi:hypothetical protein